MMSAAVIQQLSDEAARKAARSKKQPFVFYNEEDADSDRPSIPFIGSYKPKGWTLVDARALADELQIEVSTALGDPRYLFVDSSGWGSESELAMTTRAFRAFVKAALRTGKSYGYAIVEAGQFQVVVGVYLKK